jgi:hypothetical protein
MKKQILFIIIFVVFTSTINAQTSHFGVKFGTNASNVRIKSTGVVGNDDFMPMLGYNLGFFLNNNYSSKIGFCIEPGFIYKNIWV